jgi:hypothetical protein
MAMGDQQNVSDQGLSSLEETSSENTPVGQDRESRATDSEGVHRPQLTVGGSVGVGAAVGPNAQVQAQIIAGGSVSFNVPRPIPPDYPQDFVGRIREQSRLEELLTQRDEPITILKGVWGIGKTDLATLVANKLAYRFPDGCLWADVADYRGRLLPLLHRFIKQCGQDPSGLNTLQDCVEFMRGALSSKRTLVVLDHVQNAKELEHFTKLVGSDGSAMLVVTDKDSIARQAIDKVMTLGPLDEDSGIDLLARLSGKPVQDELNLARRLIRQVHGRPAFLVQVASQLRMKPSAGLKEWVNHFDDRPLSSDDTDFSPLFDVFDHCYRALPLEQQRLFRLMGIIGQSKYSIRTMAAILVRNQDDVKADLEMLADFRLVRRDG